MLTACWFILSCKFILKGKKICPVARCMFVLYWYKDLQCFFVTYKWHLKVQKSLMTGVKWQIEVLFCLVQLWHMRFPIYELDDALMSKNANISIYGLSEGHISIYGLSPVLISIYGLNGATFPYIYIIRHPHSHIWTQWYLHFHIRT